MSRKLNKEFQRFIVGRNKDVIWMIKKGLLTGKRKS